MEQAKSTFVVAAAFLMMMFSAAPLAEARGFHGGGFHGGGFHRAGGFRGAGFHRGFARGPGWRGGRVWHGAAWRGGRPWRGNAAWRGRRVWRNGRWVAIGAFPAFYGGSWYGGGGGCGWLYRRAVNTGSSYWWSRYNTCVGNW
jgi:hypothetical protein